MFLVPSKLIAARVSFVVVSQQEGLFLKLLIFPALGFSSASYYK